MPTNSIVLAMTSLAGLLICGTANAQITGEIVSTKMIWDRASINRDTDIIRYKDRWFVVCCETSKEFSNDAALRIISSSDGVQWESAALLRGPSPKASYRYDPAFCVGADGKLMVTSLGLQTFAWLSEDGRTWSDRTRIGQDDFEYSRPVWNQGVALTYAHGIHDGNSSTIQFLSGSDVKTLQNLSEETFEFIPDDAAIVFDGARAFCVLSRQAPNPIAKVKELGRQFQSGLLGTAAAPYTSWTWKPIDASLCVPTLLRLPDRRLIAAVGLSNKKDCITLCELNLSTGELQEFLEIPVAVENLIQAAYHRQLVGLAHHDGHVWVSYHATHQGKLCIHLAQVKLTQQ